MPKLRRSRLSSSNVRQVSRHSQTGPGYNRYVEERLHEKLDFLEIERSRLVQQLESQENIYKTEIQQKLKNCQDVNDAKLRQQNNKLHEAAKERDELLRKIQFCKEQCVGYDQLKSENVKLNVEKKSLCDDLSDLKKRNLVLRDNLNYLEIKHCDVKTNDVEREHEIEQLKELSSKLSSENQDHKTLISKLQNQLASSKVSLSSATEDVEKVKSENQVLLNEVRESEIKIANLLTDCEHHFNSKQESEKKIKLLKEESSKILQLNIGQEILICPT